MPYIPTGMPSGRPRRLVLKGDEDATNVRPGYTIVVQRPSLVNLSRAGLSVASVARAYGVPDSTMRTFLIRTGCDSIFRKEREELQ